MANFQPLFDFHDASVWAPGDGFTDRCSVCRDPLEGSIITSVSRTDTSLNYKTHICDGCITTLSIKIATIRRRQAGIPPVGRQ